MPEPTVTMWVVQLIDCPDIGAAERIGIDHFEGVYSSSEDSSGVVQLLVAGDVSRQAVRQLAREVERTVGGAAAAMGKEAVPTAMLTVDREQVRVAKMRAAVVNLLLDYDATPGEAFEALIWLIDMIVEKFGDELSDDDDVGPIDPSLSIN